MSHFRTYFYSLKTRKEIADCQFNGKTWLAVDGMKRDVNGNFIKHTCTAVEVANYADIHRVNGRKIVTIVDFPGEDAIAVKIWHGPKDVEWRKLVA
jgi:hypothetical protein